METQDSGTQSPTDALAGIFPDSAEGVAIVMKSLTIGGRPAVDEVEQEERLEQIRALVENATPAVRTRVVVISEVLRELAGTVRMLTMQAKADAGDPDITAGHAEVTPDGWLRVFMGEQEIGRVPYNPRRIDGMDEKLANDILSEYVRLHGAGGLDVASVTKLPVPGRRSVVQVIADEPPAP